MSNTEPTVDDGTGNEGNLAHLREQASRTKTETERADKLAKENLFLRAGIKIVDTPETPQDRVAKMLFDTFDGDSLEALTTAATDVGLLGAPKRGADELDRQQRHFRRDLGSGTTPTIVEPPSQPPVDLAYETFHADRKAGVREEDAQVHALGEFMGRAMSGDKRTMFDQEEWNRKAAEAGHGAAIAPGRART